MTVVPADLRSIGFVYASACYGRHLLIGGKTIDASTCRDCHMTFAQITDEMYAETEAVEWTTATAKVEPGRAPKCSPNAPTVYRCPCCGDMGPMFSVPIAWTASTKGDETRPVE